MIAYKRNIRPRITRPSNKRSAALLAVGALLAAALVVRSKTRQAEMANPPIGQFIEVDGIRLHYVERGQGQPLVLLHGNGSMVEDFQLSGLIDQAAQNYRVIAFDRPGFGYSDRPRTTIWTPIAQAKLLHRALEQLGIEQPIIVGHSWGTLVSLALGLEFPDYVRSLVLLSGYYYPSIRFDVPMASPPAIPIIGDLMRYTISPLLGRMMWPTVVKRLFGPAQVPPHFAKFPVWMVLRPSQIRASAAESAMMIPFAMKFSRRYEELTMPVVVMAGAGDLLINPQHNAVRLHDALSQSTLTLTPGAGHMVHHVAPEQVMEAINSAEQAAQQRGLVSAGAHVANGAIGQQRPV